MTDTIASGDGVRAGHLLSAARVLELTLAGRATDQALQDELRARRAGSRDRAQIGELVYGVLRRWFTLRVALPAASALQLVAAEALQRHVAVPPLRELDVEALRAVLAAAPAPDAAQQHNLAAPLWQALCAQYGGEAGALARALNAPATVDLRVNTLRGTRVQAQALLAAEGIASEATPHAASGLRLPRRIALQATRAFREGWVEPQDEGSQLLAEFVEARPGERIADYCAGAGGKTLALGAHMQDRGELWALDTDAARLARLPPRLARSGLRIVRTQVLEDRAMLPRECDAVLVDAPCSATGTLRRNPELRLRPLDPARLAARQRHILEAASALVRPGGRLVYATCSLLAEENEAVTRAFLAAHPGWSPAGELRLLPHRDGTDGFYAARLVAPADRRQ